MSEQPKPKCINAEEKVNFLPIQCPPPTDSAIYETKIEPWNATWAQALCGVIPCQAWRCISRGRRVFKIHATVYLGNFPAALLETTKFSTPLVHSRHTVHSRCQLWSNHIGIRTRRILRHACNPRFLRAGIATCENAIRYPGRYPDDTVWCTVSVKQER